MADKTGIQWTDSTWTPIAAYDRETGKRGWFCTRVSEGCRECYAAKINIRLGNGHDYQLRNLSKVEFRLVNLDQPVRWKRGRKIFVCSMTDLFHEAFTKNMIAQVFAVMMATPQHTYQVLTKRPEFMADLLTDPDFWALVWGFWFENWADVEGLAMTDEVGPDKPLPNVWLGTSVENQERADERIPHLLRTPAAVRFLSCEPLLESVVLPLRCESCGYSRADQRIHGDHRLCSGSIPAIDWVIVGGESGRNARPFDMWWARSLIEQCRAANVACFVKQLGRYPLDALRPGEHLKLVDTHGGTIEEWPADLRVREFPEVACPA